MDLSGRLCLCSAPLRMHATRSQLVSEALSIARYHIVLIAMMGMLTFGWLISGRHLYGLALVVGLDWFLINLMNRITDIVPADYHQVVREQQRAAPLHDAIRLGSSTRFALLARKPAGAAASR